MNQKICLFTSDVQYYSTRRFVEEAKKIPVELSIKTYEELYIDLNNETSYVYAGTESLDNYSHFIFRNSKGMRDIRKTVAGFLKDKTILNKEILSATDISTKLYKTMLLGQANLPIVGSITATSDENFKKLALETLRKYGKIIIKPTDGTHGKGISLITSEAEFDAWKKESRDYIIQEYIESDSDVRILVLGDTVLGGMKRIKKAGEFRANVSQGAHTEIFEVSAELQKIAIAATKCLKLDFAGVDIIFDRNNTPFILEVNSAPQFEGFEKATSVNVAGTILKFLLRK